MKKRYVFLVLLAVLIVAAGPLFAGGSRADSKSTELSVAWWGGDLRHQKTLSMIDKYMARFPDVKVISQYAAYTDYWTSMATQAAAGNLPDVYLVQLTYLGEYASRGLMRPLKDLIDAKKIDVSNYTQGALSGSSYNNQVVGITLGDTTACMVYNKSLLEKVGHPLPKDQMSYREFGDYLKSLAPKLPRGTVAFQLNNNNEAAIENFARNYGCYGVTSADGKQLGYTREILTDYLNFWLDLYKADVMGSMELILDDRSKQFADSLMGKGQMAVWFTNVNQGKIFQASVDDQLGMARYPVADNATHPNIEAAVCSTWAISGRTAKVDTAAQFINFMVNDWEAQEIYDMDIGVPGSKVIQDKLIAQLNPRNKIDIMKIREIELMQNILNTIEPFNGRPPSYGAIVDDLHRRIDSVLSGNMTVPQAVDAHFAAAQTLLQ
jgi:ABC-type glycerol-3-phosphate transport system substrate-binding protein